MPGEHAKHTWETLAGNGIAQEAVRRALDERRLPHGLLLHGPAQVGKRGFAVALTKHLFAGSWPAEGDEALRTVRKIERATHPDVVFCCPDMRAGKALQIKVDDVREVERLSALTPIESDRRVVIFDQADRMNPSTANSLLKLLEEPPPHCVFLLLTERRASLLPTVRSRCTPIRLAPLPAEALAAWLMEAHGFAEGQAQLAARWSEGRPGAALSLPLEAWEAHLRAVDGVMGEFIAQDFRGVFRAAERLLAVGDAARTEGETPLTAALRWTRLWLRDRLIVETAPASPELLAGGPGVAQAPGWSADALCALGDELELLEPTADRSIDAVLALETALTKVGAAKAGAT